MPEPSPDRLLSQEAVDSHLQHLLKLDPRLHAVYQISGPFPPRSRPAGFSGLARVICGQQISVASADALWKRLESLPGSATPVGFLKLGEIALRGVGLSRAKNQAITTLAQALLSGQLELTSLAALPAGEAIAELSRQKGIGPWTAEIYLMFCAGHPDIFPSGDIALQKAVSEAFAINPTVTRTALAEISVRWAPHRATAALLFWRFYAVRRNRQVVPI
jgi:DNA-3-methyladenine glycosylase II